MEWFFKTEPAWQNLIIRVTLGGVMLPHGLMKLLGWFGGRGIAGTMDAFAQNYHIPALFTLLVIAAESFGALGLIAGFATRLCAFGILADMIGAIFIVHMPHGFFMNWFGKQQGEGFEYHLLTIGMALALILAGGGKLSLDRLIAERLHTASARKRPAARKGRKSR